MEGCESVHCPHSMDGHWSHVSILLLKKVITKRRIILDMQFPNQPLGVKMEGCEVYTVTLYGWTLVSCLYLAAEKLLQKEG